MAKRKKGSLLPKRGSPVAACNHVVAELDGELSFEDQFNELLIIHSDDGKYRFYLLCPQRGCAPENFENLYVGVYPDLQPLAMGHPEVFQHVSEYFNTKMLTHRNLSQLDRAVEMGDNPQRGNTIHICDHLRKPWNVMNILDASGVVTSVEDEEGNLSEESHLTHLVICPDCHADIVHPGEINQYISSQTTTAKMARDLANCRCIYRTVPGFIQFLLDRVDRMASMQEEVIHMEFPNIGSEISVCSHLDPRQPDVIDSAGGLNLNQDTGHYLLVCPDCDDEDMDDVPVSRHMYTWNDEATIKILIMQLGEQHITPEGLHDESLVNTIADLLERPELTFSDSPAFILVNTWAPEYFEVALAIHLEEEMTEDELREAQEAGNLWEVGHGRHPITGEPEIMVRNQAVFLNDYKYILIVNIEWENDSEEDFMGRTATDRMEEQLIARTDPNGGVLYQRLTRMTRGTQHWFFVFQDEFSARLSGEQAEHVEGVIDFSVSLIED
jgi:hypothetical protein